jgi:pyruvate dehydrogenase E2 component (dihydrolipoamide acetyltransferase)
MASEVTLPELGENLEGGEVSDVKVAVGDVVEEGQTLLEVEAEKSTVEVPAPRGGRIAQLFVQKGETIKVGQRLCLIESEDGALAAAHPVAEKSAPSPVFPVRAATTAVDPAPRRTPAATVVAPATVSAHPSVPAVPTLKIARPPETDALGKEETIIAAGPATRRLARELGVDLAKVPASAPGHRVTQDDVKAYVRQLAAAAVISPPAVAGGVHEPPLPEFERWGNVERKPLPQIRRKVAENLSVAWSVIPHVTQHDLADVTELESFRRQQEKNGPKLTPTAFALKACASALKQFPQFNSSLDMTRGQLVYKHYYHIGVAVDTEHGLLVPVLRDVDKKSVRELAVELAAIADRARQKKLSIEEMRGASFTITNLGGIGGTSFTPIVNWPEVAILGMSRARLMPVVKDGQIVPRLMLPLSLSYDHRVIDGADAARFARRIAEMLENPLLILL